MKNWIAYGNQTPLKTYACVSRPPGHSHKPQSEGKNVFCQPRVRDGWSLRYGSGKPTHAQKSLHFSGDGAARIYGGNLAEAANLNITLFVFNNMELSLVQHGYRKNHKRPESYHYPPM